MFNNLTKQLKHKLTDIDNYNKLVGAKSCLFLNDVYFKANLNNSKTTTTTSVKKFLGDNYHRNLIPQYYYKKEQDLTESVINNNKKLGRLAKTNNKTKKMFHQTTINYFGHSFLDRCSDKRRDYEWIKEQMQSDKSVFVLFHNDRPFVLTSAEDKNMYSLYKFGYDEVKQFLEPIENVNNNIKTKCVYIFLGVEYEKNETGLSNDDHNNNSNKNKSNFEVCHSPYSKDSLYNKDDHKAWFAIDTSGFDENIESVTKLLSLDRAQFFEGNFLRLLAIQDSLQSSIIAQARAIFCWIDRNKYCASCGHLNTLEDAGNKLSCKHELCKSNNKSLNKIVPSNIHYPRVDPVVIMLVINQAKSHLLLGRKKQFPKNMYSCLAGFVEAGESIEESVRREVFEEAGIYTEKVVYNSSQPWPFPSTLMIGCFAYATSNEIKIDDTEIEEARWFSLEEIDLILKNQHPDKIVIPTERTIANQLISYYNKHKAKL